MDNRRFINYVSSLCTKSMLFEMATSPKPGLVDRFNPGAHEDMDIFTFLSSSSVLFPYFQNCTQEGLNFQGSNYINLMEGLRPIGIEAENLMFEATRGINTHKGMIFSMGIIAAAAGSIFREKGDIHIKSTYILERVRSMTEGISKELEGLDKKTNLTYGEKLYLKYGVKGIRGEAESGFKTIVDHSLPVLTRLMGEGKYHINDILGQTLLHLIAHTEDSNILGRHNLDILRYSQERSRGVIMLGGYLKEDGRLAVEKMDKEFIEKNISPGGAADLLGITLLLYYLEKEIKEKY